MNIFATDPSPVISASHHCDQHLHKMILESAQMLSTAGRQWLSPTHAKWLYLPAYQNHPCTRWVCAKPANAWWLIQLCVELNNIRESLGCADHNSMFVVDMMRFNLPDPGDEPTDPFVFAGFQSIQNMHHLDVHQKYQEYYRQKHDLWAHTKRPMTYKFRQVPEFLTTTEV